MPTWYQRTTWSALRSSALPAMMSRRGLDAREAPRLPEGAFLLLSNHSNSLDPLALGLLSERPIRFMANLEGVSPVVAALADIVGAYGRRKGRNDIAAFRKTLELGKAGEAIGIFPEGDRSWDGSTGPFRPGIGRLAHLLGLPLALVRQKGNYLARPRWARHGRKGPWLLEMTVFDADEVMRLSAPLLDRIAERALAGNDIKDAIGEGRLYRGRSLAEGVERLLWRCPVCGRADDSEGRGTSLLGSGDTIRCVRCGSRWELDANLRVEPLNVPDAFHRVPVSDLKDWSDWQRETLPELLDEASDLAGPGGPRRHEGRGLRAARVALSRMGGRGPEPLGSGSLRLLDGELLFENGKENRVFLASEVRGFVDNFNAFSEFGYRGERWRLEFPGGNIAKWCHALGGRGGISA